MTQSLTELIQEKTRKDRLEIQQITQNELKLLGQALQNSVKNELSLIEKNIKGPVKFLSSLRRSMWITCGVCCLIFLAFSISAWSLNSYLGREIIQRGYELTALRDKVSEISRLNGVSIITTAKGKFLVLPEKTTHRCHENKPCLPVGE